MRVYVAHNGNPEKLRFIEKHQDRLGLMFTPVDYRCNYQLRYALDNGAFSYHVHEMPFNETAFFVALKKCSRPDFVVIPDKIMQGKKSLAYSIIWRDNLPDNFNWYLAVQDGMTAAMIPEALIKRIAGIFIGGSFEWKMDTAKDWIDFAHSKNLKCHVGRIGTIGRLMRIENLGADSVDSSNFARHKRNWNELLRYILGEYQSQSMVQWFEEDRSKLLVTKHD